MLKNFMIVAIGITVLIGVAPAHAQFGLDSVSNLVGGGDSNSANNSGSLKEDAAKFSHYLSVGTVNLIKAVAKMHEAVGEADKAKADLAQAELLAKGGTEIKAEELKKRWSVVDNSAFNRADFAKVSTQKGQELLVSSGIHLGAGMIVDKKALSLAQSIVTKTPSAQDLMDGSIMNAFELAKLAVEVLPGHIKKSGSWTTDLADYFSSHKLEAPSTEDFKKQISSDLPANENNDLYSD